MRTFCALFIFLHIFINLSYPADNSVKELWRNDIYNWRGLKDTSRLDLTNQMLIKNSSDGRVEVIVATERFREPSIIKGKVLTLNGVDGGVLWEQELNFGVLGLGEVSLENAPSIVALGDSGVGYFLRASDGKILKQIETRTAEHVNSLAVSPAGDLAIVTGWGDSLQLIDPATGERKWGVKSETGSPSDEKKGFLSPVLVDISGDGVADVIVVDYWALKLVALDGRNGKQIWKANLAKKEYKSDKNKKLSGDLVFTSPCAGDLDGDGLKEVVVGTMGGAISIYSGKDGSELSHIQVSSDNPMKKEVPAVFKLFLPKMPKGGIIFQLALADLNGDGFLDIVATCYDQRIYALDGKSRKELWQIKTANYKQNQIFSQPVVADMDGDSNPDIVVYNSSGNLYCIKGQDGRLLWNHHIENNLQLSSLFLADINCDGFIDVLIPGTKRGEVVAYTTNAPCKIGEIIWGMPLGNPQNNPVLEIK